MDIQQATIHDPAYLDALEIRKEVFVEEQGVPYELEIDECEEQSVHLVCYAEDGRAVATGRIYPYADGIGKIQRIAVRKDARKAGYGRRIIEALERVGREKGFRRFILDAQIEAVDFYQKLGYEMIGEEPYLDAGLWHLKMGKSLE